MVSSVVSSVLVELFPEFVQHQACLVAHKTGVLVRLPEKVPRGPPFECRWEDCRKVPEHKSTRYVSASEAEY